MRYLITDWPKVIQHKSSTIYEVAMMEKRVVELDLLVLTNSNYQTVIEFSSMFRAWTLGRGSVRTKQILVLIDETDDSISYDYAHIFAFSQQTDAIEFQLTFS